MSFFRHTALFVATVSLVSGLSGWSDEVHAVDLVED